MLVYVRSDEPVLYNLVYICLTWVKIYVKSVWIHLFEIQILIQIRILTTIWDMWMFYFEYMQHEFECEYVN